MRERHGQRRREHRASPSISHLPRSQRRDVRLFSSTTWGLWMSSRHMTDAVVVETSRRALPGSVRWTEAQPPEMRVMVEFRALGPLEAVVAGRLVDLGAP